MCYSAESSLTAFIIGTSASLYLLLKSKNATNRAIGLFFITVNLIQLLEYFIWIDQECGFLNDFSSKMIYPILALQLLSIIFGTYFFNVSYIPASILKVCGILVTFYIINLLYSNYFNNNKVWCTKPNEDKSLQWANHKPNTIESMLYYIIFFIIPFLLKERSKGIFLLLLGIISWASTRYENSNSSNSRWCYYSSFMPTFFVILDQFK